MRVSSANFESLINPLNPLLFETFDITSDKFFPFF
nr:MAG TPA: hypothetical protein [Caudoviricetes sp.]